MLSDWTMRIDMLTAGINGHDKDQRFASDRVLLLNVFRRFLIGL